MAVWFRQIMFEFNNRVPVFPRVSIHISGSNEF